MGIMDAEKSFEAENHEMYKHLLGTVSKNMTRRGLNSYYADDREAALQIVQTLLDVFKGSLSSTGG